MTTSSPELPSRKLKLTDIADLRAYERERPQYRAEMLQIRGRRRVSLGPVITIAFESRETIRYQIQEMARVEKMLTDEEIQVELDTYNPLIPDGGKLCATMFLELTSDEQLREWLAKLIGIERHVVIHFADGSCVRSSPEAQHASQLTRTSVTSAVHYLTFELSPEQVDSLAADGAVVAIDHPEYPESEVLPTRTLDELLFDLLN